MNCLPTTTNQEFADSKQLGGFVVRSIKRVPGGKSRGLVVNNQLFSWNDCVGLRHLN